MYFASLIALLFASVRLSVQADFAGARNTLNVTRINAEIRLAEALVDADASVLIQPLQELVELYEAGCKDVAAIESFEGPGDKTAALSNSLEFWKGKMNETIHPYISSPESFKGVVISGDETIKDPDSNNTAAYKATEEKINAKVNEAIASLKKEYEALAKNKPTQLKDITSNRWRQVSTESALDAAVTAIRKQGQRSKHDAAAGNTEKGLSWLDRTIHSSTEHFKANVHDIYSSS